MENLPGNPLLPPERPKSGKVTKGRIKKRKEPLLYRIVGGRKNADSILDYLLWDVLIPAAKSTISDIVTNGIDMLLYDEPKRKKRYTRRDRDRTVVSYNQMYDNSPSTGMDRKVRKRDKYDFGEIIFETRQDAEVVMEQLLELVDTYDFATVHDFFDLTGLEKDYTDLHFGWDNLSTAITRPVRGGYILDLPRPVRVE